MIEDPLFKDMETKIEEGLDILVQIKDQKLQKSALRQQMFDEEFLAHIVLPSGKTMGDEYIPQIDGYLDGKPPQPLLTM